MSSVVFDYIRTAMLDGADIVRVFERLSDEIVRARQARGYDTPYASLALPTDSAHVQEVNRVVALMRAHKPAALVVIGIGGSALGAQAVHEAVHGRLYNELTRGCKIYFVDTVDAAQLADQIAVVDALLRAGERVIITVVTKSGKTTETIANFDIFLELVGRYYPRMSDYVVMITDAGSSFATYGKKQGYQVLEIPPLVGGRYSVFCAVGLFPLAMLGVDISALCAGAAHAIEVCTQMNMHNDAAVSACIKYMQYEQGKNIHDLFIFAPYLYAVGLWYRQLMGESIGKKTNTQHVEVGITPTVSVGSTDLHSVGQLYLGGPRDKFFTFLISESHAHLVVRQRSDLEPFVPHLQGRSVAEIMDAIIRGIQGAYEQEGRPFCTMRLTDTTPYTIGYVLQLYMLEMIYLGFLLNVCPFDQPEVELYKKITRDILAHE